VSTIVRLAMPDERCDGALVDSSIRLNCVCHTLLEFVFPKELRPSPLEMHDNLPRLAVHVEGEDQSLVDVTVALFGERQDIFDNVVTLFP
jgi:hypothetical protein